ncbi:uncharacterized protein LOC122076056 [Macadamia integrifolia]|uniref:uncharacterized protein LOC122076056 n=1 Tax=Macadamia integrifolia TaxID=60698 RepID=UPI001C4FA691|nr:uncharacterized protein LOC122076056 [Macadamia integrifolia]XP_042497274.1 uncharacterized protein LOC122076056 [Macadamia integrifolia]
MAAAWDLMVVGSSLWYLSSSSCSPRREINAVRMDPTRIVICSGRRSLRTRKSSSSPPSSNPQPEEDDDTTKNNTKAFTSPEDLNYLWKLGAGSVGGAAVIKYGSILFPEITRPNILQALIIISLPVIVAVLLLARQSRIEEQRKEPF